MKLSVYWIPIVIWMQMALVYNGCKIEEFLISGGASGTTIWCFKILSVYTLLFITIFFVYNIIKTAWDEK